MTTQRRLLPVGCSIVAVGPLSLDIEMARLHGWSERTIERVEACMATISRTEHARAHRKGPVSYCPCETCSRRDDALLATQAGARAMRARWRKLGWHLGKNGWYQR